MGSVRDFFRQRTLEYILAFAAGFAALFLCFFCVDLIAQPAQAEVWEVKPLELGDSILRDLEQLRKEISLSAWELEISSEQLRTSSVIIERLRNTCKQLSMLVDEQITLYKGSLIKWQLLTAGLCILLVISHILRSRLRF